MARSGGFVLMSKANGEHVGLKEHMFRFATIFKEILVA